MMSASIIYKNYTYKTELNEADLIQLGCMLESTEKHHNVISFCNDVFGCLNDKSRKAKDQLIEYVSKNFEVTVDTSGNYPTYQWVEITD